MPCSAIAHSLGGSTIRVDTAIKTFQPTGPCATVPPIGRHQSTLYLREMVGIQRLESLLASPSPASCMEASIFSPGTPLFPHNSNALSGAVLGSFSRPRVSLSSLFPLHYRGFFFRRVSLSVLYVLCLCITFLFTCAAMLAYIGARGYLVVESFIQLVHLPDSAYLLPAWSRYSPHIS